MSKRGLYDNIHAKKKRQKKQKAEGRKVERMRSPGDPGAPTAGAFRAASRTAKGATYE
jgi:hypothetical protein